MIPSLPTTTKLVFKSQNVLRFCLFVAPPLPPVSFSSNTIFVNSFCIYIDGRLEARCVCSNVCVCDCLGTLSCNNSNNNNNNDNDHVDDDRVNNDIRGGGGGARLHLLLLDFRRRSELHKSFFHRRRSRSVYYIIILYSSCCVSGGG